MTLRPTKKQFETLEFISQFITDHGYSPSYREIMSGCNYTSVATVALHVKNLINRGHIVKRGNSARSLEVVGKPDNNVDASPSVAVSFAQHIVSAIDERFEHLEKNLANEVLDEVYVLVGTLKILGHQELAREYAAKIGQIKLS
jgi:SOS-response transcriptional repressor LexA